jgi:MFS family permease
LGSALCGAAQNLTWLIVCRAIQGIGGGGLIQLVVIVLSDIVSLQEYAWSSHRRAVFCLTYPFLQVVASMVVLLVRHGELQGVWRASLILQVLNSLASVA